MWRANNDARTVKTEEYAPSSPDNTKPMPDKAKAIGLAKLELHGAWRRQRRNARPKSAADAAFLTAYNAGQSHPAIFQLVGKISKGSLYRWDKQLKEAAAITMSFVIIAAGPRTRVGKGGSAPKRRKSC